MTQRYSWRGTLVLILCIALAAPVEAKGWPPTGGEIVAGIVGVSVAIVVIAVVVVHESTKKRTITGCVLSGENGMRLTDEKDKRMYTLSGNTAGVKPGDRMTLQGKKRNPTGKNENPLWEVSNESKDFGTCQP